MAVWLSLTVNPPGPIAVNNTPGLCSASVAFAAAPTDNCGVDTIVYKEGATVITSPYVFTVGSHTVGVTVTDIHGNTATGQFTVTVTDTELHVATARLIASCYTTQSAAEADAVAATSATDNCGVDTVAIQSTVGTCSAVITVRVTDIHGNHADVTYNTRIDGAVPTLGLITATQSSQDVKSTGTVLQGVVNISVVAADNCSLVGGHPSVTLVNGANTESATFSGSGDGSVGNPFLYTWTVGPATSNGIWTATVSASDLCETTNATFTLNVNMSQVTGQVEMEGFVGTATTPLHSRTVVFIATTNWIDGSVTNSTVLKSWTNVLANVSGDHFDYTLTDVPENANGLSAKTAWSLRSKQYPANIGGNGSAIVNFTDGNKLRGGDFNGSNVITFTDYSILGVNFTLDYPPADITGDGSVDYDDYLILYFNWQAYGDEP